MEGTLEETKGETEERMVRAMASNEKEAAKLGAWGWMNLPSNDGFKRRPRNSNSQSS